MRDLLAMHKQLGRQPVQYCQCFVYAAVTTSLGRALGLPTRPVTTFQSAHDTDRNRAIDKFYTVDEAANGEFVPAENPKNHDSVWSFHVWNEVYFKRSDVTYTMCKALGLRSGCANGWQAVDATPQEVSSGGASVAKARNQMGPASVKLVKANVNPACAETSLAIFGCFDNEFVISEVNSDINLWLSDATAKGGWRLHGRFQADPWADPYNTVGLQISTKKKGDISATCLCGSAAQSSEACPDGEESKDCSADLDDVTRYYKDAEKSGPGDPTLPACTPADEDPDHMACSGPNLEQKPARQRGRRAAVLLDGDVGATLSFSKGLGVYPPGPVVNENGNAYSTITLGLPIQNTGSEDLGVACNFFVVAKDYRGIPFVNESETLSTAAVSGPLAIVVPAGETKSCTWSVGRDYYKEFAVTAFDVVANGGGDGEYTEAMGADEKAFMLDIRAVARGSNGQVYEGNSRKMICTPAISTRGTIVCEGGRGTAPAPTNDQAIAHLKTCSGLSSIVNDGVCHDSKNNAENCWDGGDCCTYSCSLRNGHIVELADDGKGFEYRAECQYLNDTATCFDPYFAEMPELPLTFPDRSAELVDKIYSADATDNTVCGIDGGAGTNIEDGGGGGGASGSGSGGACGEGSSTVAWTLGYNITNLVPSASRDMIAQAVRMAAHSDIIVVGLGGYQGGESHDRINIGIMLQVEALLKALSATGKPVAAVVYGDGSALSSPVLRDNTDAILSAYVPGETNGFAVADVLFGNVAPSGALPHTVYTPSYAAQVDFLDHGWRGFPGRGDRYIQNRSLVMWPFGWQLSYTDFMLTMLSASPHPTATSDPVASAAAADGSLDGTVDIAANQSMVVRVKVENVGGTGGSKPVMLMVRQKGIGMPARAGRWLAAVGNVRDLPPGETQEVELIVKPTTGWGRFETFSQTWQPVPGQYQAMLLSNCCPWCESPGCPPCTCPGTGNAVLDFMVK